MPVKPTYKVVADTAGTYQVEAPGGEMIVDLLTEDQARLLAQGYTAYGPDRCFPEGERRQILPPPIVVNGPGWPAFIMLSLVSLFALLALGVAFLALS